MKRCATPGCDDPKNMHEAWGTKRPGKCLRIGCSCKQYIPPGQKVLG